MLGVRPGQRPVGHSRPAEVADEVLSRNESVHDFEVEHSFPTLGRKTMLLNARPFPPDSKHPELILLAVEDVSALRERADELAEISRHKDEFLATLAHELRNPLAPIRSAVHYLDMKTLNEPDLKTASNIIDRQVTIMVRLIDDLLDVSRISRNTLDMRKERIDLAVILEKCRRKQPSPHPTVRPRIHCHPPATADLSGRRSHPARSGLFELAQQCSQVHKVGWSHLVDH